MSINKVILHGNLGKDPELRYTPSGTAVCTFSLATTERFKGRDGNKQERTEWHNIVVWRQLAEVCSKYLRKGSQIYCEGKLQTRNYDDRDGVKRYVTEIIMEVMDFGQNCGSNESSGQKSGQQRSSSNSYGGGGMNNQGFSDDDEIPFIAPLDPRDLKI